MQRFYGGRIGDWIDHLDPLWLEACALEMSSIQAEEQLARIEVAQFASLPQTESEVTRRRAILKRLELRAQGLDNSQIDPSGRDVLTSYADIQRWMGYWMNQR